MTDEEFYDVEVAPVLLDLARRCQDRGLGFLALAQWSDTQFSRTVTLPKGGLAILRYTNALASAASPQGINIDGFMLALMTVAREKGHSSAILAQLGIPPTPPVPAPQPVP